MPPIRRVMRWLLVAGLGLALAGLAVAGAVYWSVNSRLPAVETLRDVQLQEPLYVYAADGRLMGLFGEMRRYPVDIEKVPARLKQAFMAIEDARFYEHGGVDYKGVARAMWLIAKTGSKKGVPGGSTITQQVARQFFLSTEVSYKRKLAEMLLAMRMERELTKDEIFELYLNKSFFGNRAYGVGAAAEYYYGKTVDQLSLDEMASLASIPKFPSSGNPISNPERARERRDYTLQRMRELGFITPADERAAQAAPMHATPHEREVEVYAPYVAEMVRQEMLARYGGDVLTRGYHVTTTIDPVLQAAADMAVRKGLATYDHRHGWNKVERHFDLADGESAAQAASRIADVATQAGLIPALVLQAGKDGVDAVFGDGRSVHLGSGDGGFTGRNPAGLVKRGDLIRVRRREDAPAKATPKQGAGEETPKPADAGPVRYVLDQLPRAQATLVSLDADNGALRALIGGLSFAGNKFNRATQARRQPGSSFKPFVYAAAFERGFNPASIVLDAPVVFKDRRGHLWRPQNDSGNFAGPMRLREALVQSRNLVSVRLLDAIGVDYARRYISHFGIDEALLPPNLSMSLGTASLPPLTVAQGYASFANGGFRVTPWYIDEVRDRDGKVIFKEKPPTACRSCPVQVANAAGKPQTIESKVAGFDLGPGGATPAADPDADKTAKRGKDARDPKAPKQDASQAPKPKPLPPGTPVAPRAIDPRVAYQLVSMMRDVVLRGTATDAKVLKREDVGGKTGSTNDHRDAWFSGFGGPYVTTVWVGRDDFRTLGYREYGGKAALPIWIDYMRIALKDQPIAANDPPEGMVKVSVAANGRLVPGGGGISEWVKAEDLERMDTYVDYGPEQKQQQTQSEEAYDIF